MIRLFERLKPLDFVGIGVTRSGTTWTWQQLVKHPEVCKLPKGSSIFSPNNRPRSWLRQKNIPQCYKKCSDLKIGDYTPRYLHIPNCYDVIAKHSPDAKLLLILRNPIDRMFTQYKTRQWLEFGIVKEDFLDFFNMCVEQSASCKSGWPNLCWAEGNRYGRWLEPWLKTFGKQIHVNIYEDLVKDSLGYIQGIFKHIGVNPTFVPPHYQERERKPYNIYYEKNPIAMKEQHKKKLINYYRDSILEVQDLIGRDLADWLR